MPRLLISCGEPSGEFYAAELVAELRRRSPDLEAFGLGGDRLAAEDVRLLAHLRDLAVVGLVEVLSHLRRLKHLFDSVVAEAARVRPNVAVLIDYPDFNLRLARELKKLGIPVVYYVSPQLWAWRRGRIKDVKRDVAKMLAIFPFEEKIYQDAGVPVSFVGHPLIDHVKPPADRSAVAARLGLAPDRPVIALLPGSRNKEVAFNLPPMLGAVALLRERRPDLQFVLAAAPHLRARAFEDAAAAGVTVLEGVTRDVLSAARVAIVASGTATVETGLTLTPMVVVYRLSALTYALGKPLVSVANYAMVNLIAGRVVVPELIQSDFTPERVSEETLKILDDGPARARMLQDLEEVRSKLGKGGATSNVADEVMPFLARS
ncbi:MAG: lipid-A-disaccharide synthase [Vicinamibacteria bacterium]|nr:lipid-A-disaccharide synthase [Vicinamibacteria bacterium]MBP9945835.1 lipid-A-disaccharide synthase [Vicinamibacteria bacterium]